MPRPDNPKPLTKEGILALANKLREDLSIIQQSTLENKNDLLPKINSLIKDLDFATTIFPKLGVDWVKVISGKFSDLTLLTVPALKTLKVLAPNTSTGACYYSNPDGCFQTTEADCMLLQGAFRPGENCEAPQSPV